MKLFAISDLHLGRGDNRRALAGIAHHPEDWLIVAGDVGETEDHLRAAWEVLVPRFAQVLWLPGNHELWASPGADEPRGEALYLRLVEICREHGVLTPEDPYPLWLGDGPRCRIAPIFTLYDYSFRPPEVPVERAVDWAIESGVLCVDEKLLHADPYPSRSAWCAARCEETEVRLAAAAAEAPLVLAGHWPLRQDLLTLRLIPRFSIWCGTQRTADWHTRFRALAVVYGHLHVPRTTWIGGVRFEEVSLGYPRQWPVEAGIEPRLREILPGPDGPPESRGC